MTTKTTTDGLIHISGIPGGINESLSCTDIPGTDVDSAVRQAMRNARLGYYVGGCGYNYHLAADDIVSIRTPGEVPAVLERKGNTIYRHGKPAIATVDVIVQPTGERRRVELELACYR